MYYLRKNWYVKWLACIVFMTSAASAVHAQDMTGQAISQLLQTDGYQWNAGDFGRDREVLIRLYQQRDYQPFWFNNGKSTPQAFAVLGVLCNAASYGLRAEDYNGAALLNRLTLSAGSTDDAQIVQARALLDVDMSVAVLRFMRHLHYGRIDPRKAGFNLNVTRSDEFDVLARLNALAAADDVNQVITTIEPQFLHYQLLKIALIRYRHLMATPDLTSLPAFSGSSIKPGGEYSGAAALRLLLTAEGDLSGDATAGTGTSLDPQLVEGLQHYQKRHGLIADGVLGKQTFVALTTPFSQRVRQIELTLERWRWLPRLQSPMIVVNIPQFRLFAFNSNDDREANLLRMDVIVGQAFVHTQTPVFLADMKYLVFRPYWDVPANIVEREILPEISRNPDYLQHNQFELVRGQADDSPIVPATPDNIAQLAAGSLRLRQRPGANNALGEVKFMLPNSYNVYLHSTPAKKLFAASHRAFSHGCIRVSDPEGLAEYVLHYASDAWTREGIEAAMQGKDSQRVYLRMPIPVMIVYGTVMANEAGQVQFFSDIYGYDRKLEKILNAAL